MSKEPNGYRPQEDLLAVINFFFSREVTGLTTFGKNKRNNSSNQLEIETSLMLAEIKTLKNLQLRIYIYRHIRT